MADQDENGSVVRGALRSLFPVYLAAFLLLVGVGLAVTFLGDPQAGMPKAGIEVHVAQPAPAAPPPAKPVATDDDGLIEKTDLGPLPKIAADGKTPMVAYAGAPPGPGARIAIVIVGLGIGAKETENALAMLPVGVTLAFSPYGGDVQRWALNARSRGHEILVAVPMEPYDFPENDPGQYALRVDGGTEANIQRLNWSLTRMTGYTGVTNLFGERFLTEGDALSPILGYLAKHGLLFFDAGNAPNSKSVAAAEAGGAALVRAETRIDAIAVPSEIDKRLAQLEAEAKAKGVAVGAAALSPVIVERINVWAQTLAAKGIVLAPVSAVLSGAK